MPVIESLGVAKPSQATTGSTPQVSIAVRRDRDPALLPPHDTSRSSSLVDAPVDLRIARQLHPTLHFFIFFGAVLGAAPLAPPSDFFAINPATASAVIPPAAYTSSQKWPSPATSFVNAPLSRRAVMVSAPPMCLRPMKIWLQE